MFHKDTLSESNGPWVFCGVIPFPTNLHGNYSNYSYFLHSSNDDGRCIEDFWVLSNFILSMYIIL